MGSRGADSFFLEASEDDSKGCEQLGEADSKVCEHLSKENSSLVKNNIEVC